MKNKAEQIIEIVVSGSLSIPDVVRSSVDGRSVTLTLSGASVVGYSALLGSPVALSRNARPSQRQGMDHVKIQLSATDAVVSVDETQDVPSDPLPTPTDDVVLPPGDDTPL